MCEQTLSLPRASTLDLSTARARRCSPSTASGDDDAAIGAVDVVKQSPTMTRKLVKKPVKTTKRAKVLVTVMNEPPRCRGDMAPPGGADSAGILTGGCQAQAPRLPVGTSTG